MKIILTTFLLLILTIVYADIPKLDKQSDSFLVNTSNKPNEKKLLTESETYKLLYDNQVKSNDSILDTIFYALTGLGTAMIFVFASNWWFNEKKVKELTKGINAQIDDAKNQAIALVNDKINSLSIEKASEINQIQIKLQEEVTANITALTLKFTEFTEKIRSEIKEDNKTLTINYQKQLESFNENYRQQIISLNGTINSVSSNLKETINNKEELLKGLINAESQLRLSSINSIKADIFRNAFWMWEGRGVINNAIRALIDELEIKLLTNADLTFYLNHILETTKKLTYFSIYDKKVLKNTLKKAPETYKTIVNEILDVIENLKET